MSLIRALGLTGTECVTIVGCGGKTSLMLYLADTFRDRRVLVSTTTHIRRPGFDFCDRFIDADTEPVSALSPGITVLGRIEPSTGKLSGVPPELLRGWSREADLTLIEGDGSRGLPLKGWSETEPVVPEWSTATVGVVTVWSVGQPVDERIVLRLPRFRALTGAEAGQSVTVEHIADMVASEGGMFKNAAGRRVLLINQVETRDAEENALRLSEALRGRGLDAVVSGSVRLGRGMVLSGSGIK